MIGLQQAGGKLRGISLQAPLVVTVLSLALVALLTAALAALQRFVEVETVTLIYLIAVLFAAIRGGVIPAVVTALASVGATAFFFYPPIYDFRVHNPIHLVDLVLFLIVAVITGQLAANVHRAKMREESDALREALIGSVSHELRTPLSSIVGAASVLTQSPEIAKHPQLLSLVHGLREESERLNDHIQNMLDATRISSEGIHPHAEWIDPGDIVNAAVERKRRLLTDHKVKVTIANDLPLVHVDSTLIEKALGQLIENAVKYSAPASLIEIIAEQSDRTIRVAVRDQGSGLSMDEQEKIWERFYRSPRHRESIAGSGVGLWIARALVVACGARTEAFSAGVGRGATISIHLPVSPYPGPQQSEDTQ